MLPVASSATSSLGARLSANTRSASGVIAICPAWRTSPSCQIATCANSRCTSSPMHLRVTALTSISMIDRVKQQAGKTTPTDSRSKRIRASRRGGHLLTRALSPSSNNGLPDHVCFRMPPSRTVAPYSPPRTPSAARDGPSARTAPTAFHTGYQHASRACNRQIRKAIKTRGHFPDEQAATKLIYLAIRRPTQVAAQPHLDRRPPRPQDPLRRPTPRLTPITSPRPHTQKTGHPPARCLADDLDALVVHLRYPTRHRRRWRSTNLLERSLGEVKRRTKVIGRFPGETSCLTLVWAVLDLYISHATNGIKFTQLERQHLKRTRYEGPDETTPQEVTAA